MQPWILKCLKASVVGGVVPGLLAPVLWPVVIVLMKPGVDIHDYSIDLMGLAGVALLALVGGVLAAILLGFPMLMVLQLLNMNYVALAAVIGAGMGMMLYLVFGPGSAQAPIRDFWPLLAFFGLLGASVGMASSYVFHRGLIEQHG